MITPSFGLTATERVLPKLALDFTTASLDARVTFTRTTGASNPATYVDSSGYVTAATNNQPRFDYDFSTLTCKGLLIEESRANILFHSQDFGNAYYTKIRGAIDAVNYITSPANDATGNIFTCNTTSSGGFFINRSAITIPSASPLSCSVYMKKGTSNFGMIQLSDGSANFINQWFNLDTGTVASDAISGAAWAKTGASITPAANGYYKCTLSVSTAGIVARVDIFPCVGSDGGYLGTSGDIGYPWGLQLEAGAFATSYIPTTTASLTRNPDVAVMTSTNFSDWYSAGAGGVVARVLPSTVSSTCPALQFDDTTADEVITLQGNTTNPELVIVDGGSPQAQIDAGTIAANTVYNLGAAWNTDNCAAAVNGGAAVTDNTATIPTVTQARLGSNGTNYLNGHIQTIRYWPQRIINTEVQAFSK